MLHSFTPVLITKIPAVLAFRLLRGMGNITLLQGFGSRRLYCIANTETQYYVASIGIAGSDTRHSFSFKGAKRRLNLDVAFETCADS